MYSTLKNAELVNALKPLIKDQKILLSGASGWLGKNLIELLLDLFDNQIPDSILLTASSTKTIEIYGGRKIEVFKWDRNLISEFQPTLFINLAFLTRDKLLSSPVSEYIKINKEIINEALWATQISSVKYVLSTSSGVAKEIESIENIETDPYGKLKRIEELELEKSCEELGKALLILRVWTVSGKYIKFGDLLVIQSLISRLIKNEDFEIKSDNKVWRTYIHAYEMFGLALLAILTGRAGIVNSGGIKVELTDLAKCAIETFESKSRILHSNSITSKDSNYVSISPDLNEIAEINNLAIMDLPEQLIDTALTIRDSSE
jgi:nucleoside-diphosphate-sugar epimerase